MAWTYYIDGGDGDQLWFGSKLNLKVVTADWFIGELRRGEAHLFQVIDGQFSGQYIAITSRVLAPINAQLEDCNFASVVVHEIRNPSDSFDAFGQDAHAIGMAVIYRQKK